ncbi:MAG: molecular chaperone DnaJ [Gallionellales bacterium 35-53-114]|nr:MAG: molecular chaperone DnaJ [Gallionellales bacterium 35-53-114]OYZ64832.1 MAG: molecular chaperone DnaJ [Gallionellales bacterium 24-53-125]OZB07630.1 MAG: molecular chaperone DnaJ [Gallionellales bacterium 39-52-133]
MMPADEQELELAKLEAEQAQLEEQVALFELERETTKTDVARFQKRYYDTVGRLLVELDTLLAGLSQQAAEANPDDMEAQHEARAAQDRARQSAEEAGLIEAQPEPPAVITPECKKAYRRAAMLMHPDRATSDAERERRTQMMAQVNLAYERGDQAALEKLIVEFGEDPEAITGVDAASRMLKSARRITQLRRRVTEIEQELDGIREAEIFQLMTAVIEAEELGDNPLGELAGKLLQEIARRRVALGNGKSVLNKLR